MTTGLIRVYLDSSDYSNLSSPRASDDLKKVRHQLVDLSNRTGTTFVYSGAHISEMAPLDADYAESATTRTELLVKLCGRSTLISADRLMAAELDRLKCLRPEPVNAISDDGNWFPDLGQILTPSQQVDSFKEQLRQSAIEMGLNRKQRRLVNSKAIKRGQLRPEVAKYGDGIDLDEILERYPMRRDAAEVLKAYVLGKVTAKKADQAFLESLRDPIWMMRWFHKHHERLSSVGEWLRGPSREVADQILNLADHAGRALRTEELIGQSIISPMLTARGWKSAQEEFVVGAINSIAIKMNSDARCPDAATADHYCPGITTCLRVMHSSLRNSIGDGARDPTHSDFVDAVHAMYAPYVTFFRADRYMAPIIATHAAKYGTNVVGKLQLLPGNVEAALNAMAV